MHWPISNGGASTHFQNFPYFSNAGRYESGWVVSKSNTSCAERMTPGSARITVFRADAIAHALFKACSDFKQDQGEPLGRRGNRSSGGLLRLRLLKAPTISVKGFPAGPLPTCPKRQCFCDALNRNRGRRNADDLPLAYLSDDRSFLGRSVSGFCCTISCQYTRMYH